MGSNKHYISKELREKISRIWDYKCYFCGKDLQKKEFLENNYHHLISEASGGATDETNLVLCCLECHNIMHTKTRVTYNELRRLMYIQFCFLLDIIPCTSYSYDDDLEAAKEELKKGEEISEEWKKLVYSMKWMDNQIGGIENGFKVKEAINLSSMGRIFLELNKNKTKDLNYFLFMEQNFNEAIKKYRQDDVKDNQIKLNDKWEEPQKV